MDTPVFRLNEEVKIPLLGFGTYQLEGKECYQAVRAALEIGYCHIDAAEDYKNQEFVGRAIKDSGIPRENLFLTSKVWWTNLKKRDVFEACYKTLEDLGVNYLDLYLVHWPNREIPFEETFSAMRELKERGLIKGIGVSNFTVHHLEDALKTKAEIVNNQVEFHPSFNQKEVKQFCDEKGILITAYCPLGQGRDLKLEIVKRIAEKYQRSPAQVILNWLRMKNIVAIPRSTKLDHIRDNFQSLTWKMEPEDVQLIDQAKQEEKIIQRWFGDFDY